ncbi:MAG: OmpA family protein [Proteobacteria bacterium]|nr:OmpA family protein [Pseudomonadota bacterium]
MYCISGRHAGLPCGLAALAVLTALSIASPACAQVGAEPSLPHTGGRIATAFSNTFGPDAESELTFTAVTADTISISYSSGRGLKVARDQKLSDVRSSSTYVLGYSAKLPQVIPGTTTLGISGATLDELRSKGRASLSIMYDEKGSKLDGEAVIAENSVTMQVLVENEQTPTKAIRVKGTFGSPPRQATADFYILDNRNNPMVLQSWMQFSWEERPRQERVTRVTAGASMQTSMQQSLATLRRYDMYGILFETGSASLRPETKSLIVDIAATLKNNPSWRLLINGHTDSIGGESYNMKLSSERAAAVKNELVAGGIAVDRLQSQGLGEAKPVADNGTLEGRARNRRVELVRTDK